MAQSKITECKGGYGFNLTLKNLTLGELMALTRALRYYNSLVGNDVLAYVNNAIYVLNNPKVSEEISSSLEQLSEEMEKHPVIA